MIRRTLRLGVLFAAVTALTAGTAGIAGAGLNGPGPGTMELSDTEVAHGDTLVFGNSADDDSKCALLNNVLQEDGLFVEWAIFPEGALADESDDAPVAEGQAFPDGDGDWEDSWVVPSDVEPGTYLLFATCWIEIENGPVPAGEVGTQQVEEVLFDYVPRTFEVVAADEALEPVDGPAEPIDAAPRLTG